MRLVTDWWWWAGCLVFCSKITFDLTLSLKVHRAHLFSLNYASLDDAISPMCQIHRASTLMHADQEAMVGRCLGTHMDVQRSESAESQS